MAGLCYPDNTSKLRQQAAERVAEGTLKLADFQREDGSFDPDMIAALDPDLPIESARVNRMYGGTMGQNGLRAGVIHMHDCCSSSCRGWIVKASTVLQCALSARQSAGFCLCGATSAVTKMLSYFTTLSSF
jgi:hypothetical protein